MKAEFCMPYIRVKVAQASLEFYVMNSMHLNAARSRKSLPALAMLVAGCLFQAGCASRHVESNAGNAATLSERLTFYTVPFR